MQNAKHVFGEIKGLLCELSELGFVIWKRGDSYVAKYVGHWH